MTCTSPISIKRKDGLVREFPCGRCLACRIAKAGEWAARCIQEAHYWKYSTFVTLTYDEENLPAGRTLKKSDLQLFWKKLRKSLGERKIRYLACGEYGEEKRRPHYHAIIFGMKPCKCRALPDQSCKDKDRMLIFKAWGKGGVPICGTMTYKSARYVVSYILKALYMRSNLDLELVKPFLVMSRGIGLRYASDHYDQIKRTGRMTVEGVPVRIPRYYIKKLELEPEDFWRFEDNAGKKQPASKRRYVWTGNLPDAVINAEAPRKQRERDLKALTERKENKL